MTRRGCVSNNLNCDWMQISGVSVVVSEFEDCGVTTGTKLELLNRRNEVQVSNRSASCSMTVIPDDGRTRFARHTSSGSRPRSYPRAIYYHAPVRSEEGVE